MTPPLALASALRRLVRCFHCLRRRMIIRTCLLFERAIVRPFSKGRAL